jgi:aspartate racemase
MSWESTALYYRWINEGVRRRLGGLHSAPLALYSVDFAAVERLQAEGDWSTAGELLAAAGRRVQAAGADALLLCTNTMHRVADVIEAALDIPLLHIADATATRVEEEGVDTVGLLGTRFTMEQDFYRGRLERLGLRVLLPPPEDRAVVHRIIYEELCLGVIRDDSRHAYRRIIADLAAAGARGVIEGCTEIGLLVGAEDSPVPLFDTAAIHAEAGVEWALGSGQGA